MKRATAEWAAAHLSRRDMVAPTANRPLLSTTGRHVPAAASQDCWSLPNTAARADHDAVDVGGPRVRLPRQQAHLRDLEPDLQHPDAIERFGSDEHRREGLPSLCDGSAYGALAITELESVSDAHALAASAERRDDGSYVLEGTRAHVTLGPWPT